MPFNPFNGSDGPNLEQGNPLGTTVKNAAKAVSAQAVQQAKAANKAFIDQLYGNTSSNEDADKLGQSGNQQTNQLQKQAANLLSNSQNEKTPDELKKIDDTRKQLQDLQGGQKKYWEATFGEEAHQKLKQEEEQRKQLQEQEEQAIAEKEAQEKAAQEEEMGTMQAMGKGKGNGRNRMSQPIALSRAKTKTEINRGATG